MSQQTIGIGSAPNDNTGDPVRTAFNKCNLNFTELYNLTNWPQRRVTVSPITVLSSDYIINCAISSGSPTCNLPAASSRAGVPLVFKDSGGQFSAYPLTLTATSGDTIDGLASLTLNTNYSRIQLRPYNDGTTAGWSVET
jgi:hypothetical protein